MFKACWVRPNDMVEWEDFKKRKFKVLAKDKHGRDVYLSESAYDLQMAQSKFKGLDFFFTSEF
jgi:peptide chain release factor 3